MTPNTKPKPVPPPPTRRKGSHVDWEPRGMDLGYTRILAEAGYPKHILVLDFETYFTPEYSLSKSSTIEYVKSKKFEVLGMSTLELINGWDELGPDGKPRHPIAGERIQWHNGLEKCKSYLGSLQYTGPKLHPRTTTRTVHKSYAERKEERFEQGGGSNLSRYTLVGHNTSFDCMVLAHHFDIYPKYVIDTLGLARHWDARNNNDLKSLAKRFKLPDKGDTKTFTGWTNKNRISRPAKKGNIPVQVPKMDEQDQRDLGFYANMDVNLTWHVFLHLLPRLSNPSTELQIMQHTLELFTKPTLMVDYEKAGTLKVQMDAEIDRTVEKLEPALEITRADISGEISFEALMQAALREARDDVQNYIKPAKNKKGWKFAIAKTDLERGLLLRHEDKHVASLMKARVAIKSWPNHIKRVGRIVAQSKATDGYLCVPLKYCGAHTARWSGGEKINLQNLGSRGHDLVNAIREIIVAPEGKILVIADAAQIEARVLAWIAGQDDLLEKFKVGEEIYCGFATKVLGQEITKPDSKIMDAVEFEYMKWARNSVGKVGILGCGYGMGGKKAKGYSGDAITIETAEDLVKTYREDNDKIVQFWREVERAFAYTFKHGRPCEMARGLKFHQTDDCDVIITLPSGRELKYHNVKNVTGNFGKPALAIYNPMERKWAHTWGGALTENIVQAISRDLLWHAIQDQESQGNHVAHHVHDEIIIITPKEGSEKVLKSAITSLRKRPTWCKALPLDAEGLITRRYGGH